jgi:decaprenylphospho-beta-D-erythro-pentofuranosid-2-ulose 2-reductase
MFAQRRNNESFFSQNVVVVGATSSLARAIALDFASKGARLFLVARDEEELPLVAEDIRLRCDTEVMWKQADLLSNDFVPEELLEACEKSLGPIDILVLAFGTMGSAGGKDHPQELKEIFRINYALACRMMNRMASMMAPRGRGTIVSIGSVAGDRGRAQNYAYGSAKAGLEAFASGLRQRYSKQNIHVLLVKPGFLDTAMTFGMNLPIRQSPEAAARRIVHAVKKSKDVVYTPFFW